jgi:hypothetical protein
LVDKPKIPKQDVSIPILTQKVKISLGKVWPINNPKVFPGFPIGLGSFAPVGSNRVQGFHSANSQIIARGRNDSIATATMQPHILLASATDEQQGNPTGKECATSKEQEETNRTEFEAHLSISYSVNTVYHPDTTKT